MGKLFGTDGVRGVANTELTPDLAFKLGRAGAFVLTKHTSGSSNEKPKILIGLDSRISGDMLSLALASGICSVGAHVSNVGIIPTPAIAYLVRHYKYDAGVVISASHNPFEFNGIKFFDAKGFKLADALEDEIEDIIFDDAKYSALPNPTGAEIGGADEILEAVEDYVAFLASNTDADFSGMKVLLDCANGASYKAAPLAFADKKAQVFVINNEPNGININDNCGSTHMESLMKEVVLTKADAGFAFDGDADRCLAVDEHGELVDGDKLLTICGNYMKELGTLKKNTIVATVMSNLGFFIMGKEKDISIPQTKVGDRYVLEYMLENGCNIGGEQSGHIIFLDKNTTGDGILTALTTLLVMKRTGKPLSELAKQMTVLPQALINAKVANDKKYTYMEDDEIKAAIAEVESRYAGEGRVLIRPSGTEPLVRVMIEGKDLDAITKDANEIAELIRAKLG